MKFKVEVIADNSGTWAGNALTFDTEEAAEAYARDLMSRWMLVREWRVVPVSSEPHQVGMEYANDTNDPTGRLHR